MPLATCETRVSAAYAIDEQQVRLVFRPESVQKLTDTLFLEKEILSISFIAILKGCPIWTEGERTKFSLGPGYETLEIIFRNIIATNPKILTISPNP